jgi:hypothetical protein
MTASHEISISNAEFLHKLYSLQAAVNPDSVHPVGF